MLKERLINDFNEEILIITKLLKEKVVIDVDGYLIGKDLPKDYVNKMMFFVERALYKRDHARNDNEIVMITETLKKMKKDINEQINQYKQEKHVPSGCCGG